MHHGSIALSDRKMKMDLVQLLKPLWFLCIIIADLTPLRLELLDVFFTCYCVLRVVLIERGKAIKNLLKQIFLPRGESLLITKQIGRDDKWLYISILFSFLLFFPPLCIFYFEKASWKAACPLCQSVFLQLQAAGGSSGCQSCEALTLSSLDSGRRFTIHPEQFFKAVSEALFSSCLNKCNIN